jgi:hypothetical protein
MKDNNEMIRPGQKEFEATFEIRRCRPGHCSTSVAKVSKNSTETRDNIPKNKTEVTSK